MHALNILISVCLLISLYFDIYFLTPVQCQFQSFFRAHLQGMTQKVDWDNFAMSFQFSDDVATKPYLWQ